MTDLNEAISAALASFRRLDAGKAVPTVVVSADGEHVSAAWQPLEEERQTLPSAIALLRKHVKHFRFR